MEGRNMNETVFGPKHVDHCINLLRTALLCNPDTTVEVETSVGAGVLGFGETHQCVDWSDVTAWTAQFQDATNE